MFQQFDTRPHHCHTQVIHSYLPGGTNVHAHLIHGSWHPTEAASKQAHGWFSCFFLQSIDHAMSNIHNSSIFLLLLLFISYMRRQHNITSYAVHTMWPNDNSSSSQSHPSLAWGTWHEVHIHQMNQKNSCNNCSHDYSIISIWEATKFNPHLKYTIKIDERISKQIARRFPDDSKTTF